MQIVRDYKDTFFGDDTRPKMFVPKYHTVEMSRTQKILTDRQAQNITTFVTYCQIVVILRSSYSGEKVVSFFSQSNCLTTLFLLWTTIFKTKPREFHGNTFTK